MLEILAQEGGRCTKFLSTTLLSAYFMLRNQWQALAWWDTWLVCTLYLLLPHGGSSEILQGGGVLKTKIFKGKYVPELDIPEGRSGFKPKTLQSMVWVSIEGRIQDFEMGGGNIKKNQKLKYYFNIWGTRKKKERRGLRKRGGGGDNSPISPPLDPPLQYFLDQHISTQLTQTTSDFT